MRQANYQILNAVANSGTPASAAIQAEYLVGATCQATFTDNTAAGTLKLQGSNDPSNGTPTNWSDVPNSSISVASGATSCTPPLAAPLCYNWIRVVFARSAGAGTISANMQTFGV